MRKIIISFCICISLILIVSSGYTGRYHGHRRKGRIYREGVPTPRTVTPSPRRSDLYSKPKAVGPIKLPAPIGPKKLIAVADFENKTSWAGQANLGTGMADQLITGLMNTGRFIVLERESIESILREQDFGVSGRTTAEGGARIGRISRAQIFIQGAVTEFEQRSSSGAGGISVRGFSFSTSEARAHVAVDVRIYDTTTGHILASKACKGTAKASGGSFGYSGGDFGFAAGGEARTPLDYAVRDAIYQAVYFISLELQKIPWAGRVAMVKGPNIYINCGRTAGIFVGDQFSIWRPGEPIIDPETGLNLGSENTQIGKIEVIGVDEKFSKSIPVAGAGFIRNDIVKFEGRKPPASAVPGQP